jgi:phosphatidylserine decarboxylase
VAATGWYQENHKWEGNQMEVNPGDLHWFKSSASAAGNCVEVAHLPGGGVAVRDTKDRAKTPHAYTRSEWDAFLIGAKNGEFDLPSV